MKKLFIPILLLFLLSSLSIAQVKIDGVFFDWNPDTQLDIGANNELTFAEGDPDTPDTLNTSYFADLDVEDLYATDDADFIYIRIKMNSIANIENIPNDTSYHGGAAIAAYLSVDPGVADTTGLTWGWWGSGYDFQVPVFPVDSVADATTLYDQYLFEHSQNGNGYDFAPSDTLVGVSVAWNFSNNDVEMAIPKSLLFNPKNIANFVTPDTISIMIYAGENLGPWRADYASLPGVAGFKLAISEPGPIAIDGTFFDWNTSTQLDVAPNSEELTFADGDPDTPDTLNTSYFADLDVEDLFVTSSDNEVFFRIKMNSIANVMNIPNDTSYHGGAAIAAYISVDPGDADTTGLTWGWWGSGYDFQVPVFPADSAFAANTPFEQPIFEHSQNGTGYDFAAASETVGAKVSWNFANNDVEFSVPKSILTNPNNLQGITVDEIAVMIYAGENLGPWRADYASEAGVAGFRFKLDGATGVENELNNSSIPSEYSLSQNYPNPFNPTTNISFSLPTSGNVKLTVFNSLGQEVSTLVNENLSAGQHFRTFNAKGLSSGVYFYTLEAGQTFISQKMLLLK
jgi:Secretion system C-terminal sorting domain